RAACVACADARSPSMLVRLPALLAAVVSTAALVTFAPRARAQTQNGQPFIQQTERALARVAYFGQKGLSGEYSIEYGKPDWKAEYDKDFDKLTHGKRLRLGKDYWTNLDTCCPLQSGDKEIKPGNYFLVLECSEKGTWELVLLDSDLMRKQRIDAFSSKD